MDPSDDTPVDILVDLPHMLDKFASVAPPDRFADSPIDMHSDNCFGSYCKWAHSLLDPDKFAADKLVEPPDTLADRLVDNFDFDRPADNWLGIQVVCTLAEILVRSAPHFDNTLMADTLAADKLVDIVGSLVADTLEHIAVVAVRLRAHSFRELEMMDLGCIDLVTFAVRSVVDYFLHRFDKRNFHQLNLGTSEVLNDQ